MIEAFRRDLGLKFAAVIIAIVLWFTFNYLTTGEATYSKTLVLPVAVQHIASGLVATVNVHQVTIELAGARPKLEGLTPDSFVAFVDAAGKGVGTYSVEISTRGPATDSIRSVTPGAAELILDHYGYRVVPVVVRDIEGSPDLQADLEPSTVTVAGAATVVASVVAVQTTVALPGPHESTVMEVRPVAVDAQLTPVAGVTIDPPLVRATITVRQSKHAGVGLRP
jgi:YbbR domain-containing protein